MLFGLLQAALRHEPTRRSLLSSGDYKQFHRQLSHVLARGLAQPSPDFSAECVRDCDD